MRRVVPALAGLALFAAPSLSSAQVQMVSGVIQPILGVTADGQAPAAGGVTVTTERHGDQIVVTVVPAG